MPLTPSVARIAHSVRTPPALSHLGLRRVGTQGRPHLLVSCASAAAAAGSLHQPRRCLSQQASRWLDKLRYGAEDAPSLGSWENAYEDKAMDTRKLYCKALVHASGGSRLARDWIAGCAALTSPDPSLIYTALQHTATEVDVEELREHFLQRLIAQDEEARALRQHQHHSGEDDERPGSSTAAHRRHSSMAAGGQGCITSFARAEEVDEREREVLRDGEEAAAMPLHSSLSSGPSDALSTATAMKRAAAAGSADTKEVDEGDDDDDVSLSPDSVRAAEHLLLSRSPEVRCFMYDAMTASLFHSNYDLRTVEVARRHTFFIGANVFGIAFDELTLLWRVVEAELLLKKEKIKVLGQPWSE